MIEMTITRKCGHREKIAVMTFSGSVDDIPIQQREAAAKNIQWQWDKLCLQCFNKLPPVLRRMEIENG